MAEGGRRAPWRARTQRPAHFGEDIALRLTSQAQATAVAQMKGSCGTEQRIDGRLILLLAPEPAHTRVPPPLPILSMPSRSMAARNREERTEEKPRMKAAFFCANVEPPTGWLRMDWVSNRMDVSRSCDSLLWSSSPLMTSVRPPRSSPGVVAGVAGLCGVVAHALSAEEADSGSGKARQRAAGRPGA